MADVVEETELLAQWSAPLGNVGWKSYVVGMHECTRKTRRLNNGVYVHEVVVHAHNFIDPNRPDVHTQTIEGMLMQAKRQLRYQSGTSRDLFPSYLAEFQWRYSQKTEVYGQYSCLLSKNYGI